MDVLNLNDLALIDPVRGNLLIQLSSIISSRLPDHAEDIVLDINGSHVSLDELGLTFEYNPPSRVFGYTSHPLKPNGENIVSQTLVY